MRTFASGELQALSEAFAFLGNSLLKPINQTPTVGLDPAFWEAFPCFGDDAVRAAVEACRSFAQSGRERAGALETQVATEYTRLFIGPPKPAAAPWESAYRGGNEVGFGAATFEMRAALRDAGLAMAGENNQYADHLGIELLLLSTLLGRAACGEAPMDQAQSFAAAHPARWVGDFRAAVDAAAPGGYHACLISLVQALLGLLR